MASHLLLPEASDWTALMQLEGVGQSQGGAESHVAPVVSKRFSQNLGSGHSNAVADTVATICSKALANSLATKFKWNIDSARRVWSFHRSFLEAMYAVMETGGKQYRVAAGDTLEIDRLNGIEPGQPFVFDRVLLVNQDGKVALGKPTLSGAKVVADIVEHKRGDKVIIFKMKRRKGYHKKQGFRAELTVVKIKDITA
jgi:large subunit ribosomal protein L21